MRIRRLGALAALALLGIIVSAGATLGQNQDQGPRQQLKQVQLTDTKMQSFISAQKELAPLVKRMEAAGYKPDPAFHKEVQQIAERHGFANVQELATVTANVSMVLTGLDARTGQFTELPDLIRKQIEAVQRNEQLPQPIKEQALAQMQQALKTAAPLQFKENVDLVRKYQKEIDEIAGPRPTGQDAK
jgi:hypothetical protein